MTKNDLADKSGVSPSYLSDLTSGGTEANPSLKVMEQIADALDTPLPFLLESTDWSWEALQAISGGKTTSSLPPGYERVSVVLPEHRAFQVKKWGEETRQKLRELNSPSKGD